MKDLLRLLLDSIPDGVGLYEVGGDDSARLVAKNPALREPESDEMTGRVLDVSRSGAIARYEMTRPGPDGPRLFESTLAPVPALTSGRYVAVIEREVTARAIDRARLDVSERLLIEMQQVSRVGSWEWDITLNTVVWSDQLYRVYGRSPQEFRATYEGFLELVHPGDRQRVDEAVRRSFETGEPFSFNHRAILPDGSRRWIHGRGQVFRDDDGNVVRMAGTGEDITQRLLAEEALQSSEQKFRGLLASAPDAVVGVDARGVILLINQQVEALFGYTVEQLIGRPIELLLPERYRTAHVGHRRAYVAAPRTRPMGADLELFGCRKDGSEFPVDVALSSIEAEGGRIFTAFIRDVTERRANEDAARRLHESVIKRRQALEINDGVVQGLASAVYALESGDERTALRALQETLDSSREMMAGLLEDTTEGQGLAPGDLVRAEPATVMHAEQIPPAPPRAAHPGPVRVVIVDDTPDIRMLLRYTLSADQGFDVVGEAADGEDAIAVCAQQKPDIVLLDLAMPVMDGLQALPEIRRRAPGARIVVLSGYGRDQMAVRAMELGAHGYIEKGTPVPALLRTLREFFPARTVTPPTVEQPADELGGPGEGEMLLSTYLHELRTPVTVLGGVVETLSASIDRLPSAVVREFLQSMHRNIAQMTSLIDTFSDARKIGAAALPVVFEKTDLTSLVRRSVPDLSEVTKDHEVALAVAEGLVAEVDPIRIRQVLTNLLSNAAKFSPAGSVIEVALSEHGDQFSIAVTDHGSGIPADKRAQLFGKFARLQGEHAGLGLGLYLSRGIAQAHGGDLRLDHSDQTGTMFVFTAPRMHKDVRING